MIAASISSASWRSRAPSPLAFFNQWINPRIHATPCALPLEHRDA